MTFFDKVYEQVKRIPKGKVATYGQIACLIGSPKASQAVGWALHVNPDPINIPCHRVVNRFGGLTDAFAFGGRDEHKARLEAEGVEVKDYIVNLDKFGWQ